ncbi:hypothetical protein Gotur_018512 [Gossypium turneri]
MDGSAKVMESLDSLWFFNNVLTLPTLKHHIDRGVALNEDTVEEEEVPSKLVPRCPKCGEIAAGLEQHIMQPITEDEFKKPTQKPEKMKRSKGKVLGELDLGFHGKLTSDSSISVVTVKYPIYYTKMPPLDDGLAMKEHLKSWAYAVACITTK